MKTDFLVIGSGIAGLSFALKAAKAHPKRNVTIICKAHPKETNTKYAQGGIAVVTDLLKDSPEKHIEDTLKAGGKLCDKKVVEFVVKEGPERLQELIDCGVNFDKTKEKTYDLAKEGGHSSNRILHKGDYTGLELERKLLARARKMPNIAIISNTLAIDLITNKHLIHKPNAGKNKCYGAFVLNLKSGELETILSKITIIATGGVGQLFEHTTNSETATGDGIAMAYRAKAKIKNMEFIQFHPTALYQAEMGTDFLISEAVRGFGAVLKTCEGKPFMEKYDVRKDLATRDIVARAIETEIKHREIPYVFLDCRHIPKNEFVKHFPNITTKCVNLGIDPMKKMIPVVPSAHYCCGGIKTDHFGNTTVENLYACGECACTGLHGSNRLASNSLLEAVVFAHRCYLNSCRKISKIEWVHIFEDVQLRFKNETIQLASKDTVKKIKKIMSKSLGIITAFNKLEKGIQALKHLKMEGAKLDNGFLNPGILQVRNMLTTALLILYSSKKRRRNEGVFYNSDLRLLIPNNSSLKRDNYRKIV